MAAYSRVAACPCNVARDMRPISWPVGNCNMLSKGAESNPGNHSDLWAAPHLQRTSSMYVPTAHNRLAAQRLPGVRKWP